LVEMSKTYKYVENRKNGFNSGLRIESFLHFDQYIFLIRKEKTNITYKYGPCEFFLINYNKEKEHKFSNISEFKKKLVADELEYTASYIEILNLVGRKCRVNYKKSSKLK